MAHAFSVPEDYSFYTRYSHGTTRLEPSTRPLRDSLIAATAAFAFCGLAITYGIHKLPSVEALDAGRSTEAIAAAAPQSRSLLETLPPDIAAQARTQPVHVNATVQAPDIPAALYGDPASRDIAYDVQPSPADGDDAIPADAQTEPSDAVVDDSELSSPPSDDSPIEDRGPVS